MKVNDKPLWVIMKSTMTIYTAMKVNDKMYKHPYIWGIKQR